MSRLVWFEASGHYPFVEERERFWFDVVGPFLTTAPSRKP